jgi:hypothetical protein
MGSLELVGEVYKVRTQVDRDLTTVSSCDRLLRLNKNLGTTTYDVRGREGRAVELAPILDRVVCSLRLKTRIFLVLYL